MRHLNETPKDSNGDLHYYIEVQLRVSCMRCHKREVVWAPSHRHNREYKKTSLVLDSLPAPWSFNCIGLPECGCAE